MVAAPAFSDVRTRPRPEGRTRPNLEGPRFGIAALVGAGVIVGCYTRALDIIPQRLGLPSMIGPAAIAAIVLLSWAGARRLRPRGGALVAMVVLAIIHIWLSLFSVLWAGDRGVALEVARFAAIDAIVLVMVGMLVVDTDSLRLVLVAIVAAGAAMATLSVFQYLTGTFDRDYFGFATAPLANVVGEVDSNRIAGPIGDPNFFAQLLAVSAVLAIHLARHARLRWEAALLWYAGGICVTGVLFSFSRGGLFSLVVGLGLTVMLEPVPIHRIIGLAVALAFVVFLVVPQDLASRLGELKQLIPGVKTSQNLVDDPALRGRQSEALVAVEQFRDHPLLGVGAGNYKVSYQKYARRLGIDQRGEDRSAHSLYLETAAEHGVVGLAALLGVVAWAMGSLRGARRRLELLGDREGAAALRAMTLGLVTYLCGGLFLHSAFPLMLWLLVAVAVAAGRVQAARPSRRFAKPRTPVAKPAATTLLGTAQVPTALAGPRG